jgi:hypothetical protein
VDLPVQSWTTNSTHVNIATSTDLTSWTHVTSVPSGIANTRSTWAPEFSVEGSTSRDLYSWSGLSAVGCSGCRHGTVARA